MNRYHRQILLVFLACFVPTLIFAKSNFRVAPGVIEFDLSKNRTQSFVITNSGDERIRLVIRPIYFEIQSKYLAAGSNLNPENPPKDDISELILVSPKVISLSPGQKRTVRIAVRMKEKLPMGDYRAHILIKSLLKKPQESSFEEKKDKKEGLSIKLELNIETAVAVYGRIGMPDTILEWDCRKNKDGDLLLRAENKSPWRYYGWLAVYDETKEKRGKPFIFTRVISFRESERYFMIKKPYPNLLSIHWGADKDRLNDGSSSCSG
ncbi:MAG: hypothetical protein OEY59_06525 [Deltaproteobacteria bacterium]|nr:hypothetical protein [Deltaproteobacteria bacterium]